MIHFLVNISQILANRNAHHSLDDIKKEKKCASSNEKRRCPKQKRSKFLSIYGGIPCNLAPAHFTVHIAYAIKLRSRVCRGGESCMRSFFACCVFMYLYGLRFPAASTLSGGRREIGSAASPLRSPFL